MKKLILLLIPLLIVSACANRNENVKPITTPEKEMKLEVKNTTDTDLSRFFMKNNSIAQFKGEGNEYASFSLKTLHLFNNFIATTEDNGGTIVERIYRVYDDHISKISENYEADKTKQPTLQELEAMPELEIYLASPLTNGTEFNGWKIKSTSDVVQTEFQTFKNVIVIEKKEEQNTIVRKYFAKSFGEVKREFIMNTNGEETIVTSSFEKIL
ncbi:hypothetical protein [Psychrobacillus sp. L3]|uniref:hypothetical protein n=1 Tax=Psychrobacillus sp. L3 TaxID=3236891 RepID=UPI0036F2C9B1